MQCTPRKKLRSLVGPSNASAEGMTSRARRACERAPGGNGADVYDVEGGSSQFSTLVPAMHVAQMLKSRERSRVPLRLHIRPFELPPLLLPVARCLCLSESTTSPPGVRTRPRSVMTISKPPTPNPSPPLGNAAHVKSEPQPQSQSLPHPQPKPQLQPQPQSGAHYQAQPQTQSHSEPQPQAQPQPLPRATQVVSHAQHHPPPHTRLPQPQTPQTHGPKPETVLPSTPTTPGPQSPLSASKKLKGGRRVVNPHLTDEQRRRERVLKNRESAMKSLQKKKRYTEDLEHRAVALASRNRELRDKIRLLLARLQQMGIVAVPGVGVVFSSSAVQTPYSNMHPSPAAPVEPPNASAPIIPCDWSVDFANPAPISTSPGPAVSAPTLQLPDAMRTTTEVATPTATTTIPQDDISAMINPSLPIVGTPPTSPALALQPDIFSLSEPESKLGVFDIPHMTCQ